MTHQRSDDPIQEDEGDTFARTINITDDNDNPIDITGWTFYVTVKKDLDDSDSNAVLSTQVTSHDNASNGESSFSFADTETEGLESVYWFELKYEDDTGTVETVIKRRIEFDKAVRNTT